MKKTLIALAAVAVAGAASAQVTVSGKIGFGYSKDSTTKGYEMTDGVLTFAGSEDLGGGLKAGFKASIDNALSGRQASTVIGNDATISLSSGPLSLTVGSFESTADALKGDVSGASAEKGNDESQVNLQASNVDAVVLGFKAAEGLDFGLVHAEAPNATGTALGDVTPDTKLTKVIASYVAGPLTAFTSYIDYTGATKSVTSFALTYDLGVAKVGYGLRKQSGSEDSSVVSVNVPMGAVDIGASYTEGATGTATTIYNTTVLGVNYALSKRTKVQAAIQSSNNTSLDDSYRVKVVHSF